MGVFAGRCYALTERSFKDPADFDEAARQEFGPDARAAEWNDLKAQPGTVEECRAFLDELGTNPWIKYNGTCGQHRKYFFERHNGKVPGGGLSHDHLHNHLVDLGSWYGMTRQVLVDLGEC